MAIIHPGSHGLVNKATSDTSRITFTRSAVRLGRMKRQVITSSRLHQETLQTGGFRFRAAMVTLTYRECVEWTPYQVTEYVKRVRQWLARRGYPARYVWVLELTLRGRPHYHIIWWLPRGVTMPMADKQGWWPHGFTKSEWARNAVGYLAKYASKGTAADDRLPERARLQGAGGLDQSSRRVRRWWMSPKWLRDQTELGDDVRKVRGGWTALDTGEFFKSPWLLVKRSRNWETVTMEREVVA